MRRRHLFWSGVVVVLVVLMVLRIAFDPGPDEAVITPMAVLPDAVRQEWRERLEAARPDAEPREVEPVLLDATEVELPTGPVPPSLRVLDEQDQPIDRLVVFPVGDFPNNWARRDGPGVALLPDPERWSSDALFLDVGAPGFRRRQIEVPKDGPWPFEVVLAPSTILEVRLVSQSSLPTDALQLHISSEGPLYEDGGIDSRSLAYRPLAGEGPSGHVFGPGPRMTVMAAVIAGSVRINGARPGQALHIVAEGPGRTTLAAEQVELAPGEHRIVTLVITAVPRRLEGQVVDREGRPLPGVRLELRPDGSREREPEENQAWLTTLGDDEGRYAFDFICSDGARLVVAEDGFARHEAQIDLSVTRVHDIRLLPAAPFELELLHADSLRPVTEARVADEWGGWIFAWEQVSPGRYRSTGLPPRPVDLAITHRGDEYTAVATPGEPGARVLISETGDVIVHGVADDVSGYVMLRVTCLEDDTRSFEVSARAEGTLTLREVPPGAYTVSQLRYDGASGEWVPRSMAAAMVSAGGTSHAMLLPVDHD